MSGLISDITESTLLTLTSRRLCVAAFVRGVRAFPCGSTWRDVGNRLLGSISRIITLKSRALSPMAALGLGLAWISNARESQGPYFYIEGRGSHRGQGREDV
jgi:hypothetical protein